jgi:hypothetical protein
MRPSGMSYELLAGMIDFSEVFNERSGFETVVDRRFIALVDEIQFSRISSAMDVLLCRSRGKTRLVIPCRTTIAHFVSASRGENRNSKLRSKQFKIRMIGGNNGRSVAPCRECNQSVVLKIPALVYVPILLITKFSDKPPCLPPVGYRRLPLHRGQFK